MKLGGGAARLHNLCSASELILCPKWEHADLFSRSNGLKTDGTVGLLAGGLLQQPVHHVHLPLQRLQQVVCALEQKVDDEKGKKA